MLQGFAKLNVIHVLPMKAVLVVFNDRQFVLFECSERLKRWQAGLLRFMLDQSIEKDSSFAVFYQMLEIGVAAVLSDQSLANQILLQFLNLAFL